MWTRLDDTLAHQIRLFFHHPLSAGTDVAVSCLCRRTGTAGDEGPHLEPIAQIRTLDEAWAEYYAWHDAQGVTLPLYAAVVNA